LRLVGSTQINNERVECLALEFERSLHPDVDATGRAEITMCRFRRVLRDFFLGGWTQKLEVIRTIEMEIGCAQFLAESAVAAEDLEVSGLRVRLDIALVFDASKLPLINYVFQNIAGQECTCPQWQPPLIVVFVDSLDMSLVVGNPYVLARLFVTHFIFKMSFIVEAAWSGLLTSRGLIELLERHSCIHSSASHARQQLSGF
jgi:hypothetical protein